MSVVVPLALMGPLPLPANAAPVSRDGYCASTAASKLGWGAPNRTDDFSDPSSLNNWFLYDAPGHDGNGIRTPKAISVSDGVLTITGDPAGNSGGMAFMPGQLFGRWEVCAKSPPASPNYHSVALLWPDSLNWPTDGEIDFMEIRDPTRQTVTGAVLHFDWHDEDRSPDRNFHTQTSGDATQWHSWAVEWAPDHITAFMDGVAWFEVTDHVPQNPMHLCLQVDNLGGDISEGGQQMVDWVRQYAL